MGNVAAAVTAQFYLAHSYIIRRSSQVEGGNIWVVVMEPQDKGDGNNVCLLDRTSMNGTFSRSVDDILMVWWNNFKHCNSEIGNITKCLTTIKILDI